MIRVQLPFHLRTLAGVGREIEVDVDAPVTQRRVIDVIEATYPMLKGAIRDQQSGKRRPFIRFFALERDFSHDDPDTELPDAVASGSEPFLIVGAIAGG
jgi:hypothetical protein